MTESDDALMLRTGYGQHAAGEGKEEAELNYEGEWP